MDRGKCQEELLILHQRKQHPYLIPLAFFCNFTSPLHLFHHTYDILHTDLAAVLFPLQFPFLIPEEKTCFRIITDGLDIYRLRRLCLFQNIGCNIVTNTHHIFRIYCCLSLHSRKAGFHLESLLFQTSAHFRKEIIENVPEFCRSFQLDF